MTDPRAIARLDGPDREPLRYRISYGYPAARDPQDGNFILASDSGSGIITHIWFVSNIPDSTTNFKLYIDDELISSSTYSSFFDSVHGILRPPFDTTYPPVAKVCDIQLPYKRNFKITFIGAGITVYYAIAWRPVLDSSLLPSFRSLQSFVNRQDQISAENIHDMKVPMWQNEKPVHFFDTASLIAGTKATLCNIKGPAMIEKLHFKLPTYDFDQLDSVSLNIYWDNSPYPAVHVPLSDFFCSSNTGINVRSYAIRRDSSGLTSYFAMPFAVNARIELQNTSKRDLQIQTEINYSQEPIDKSKYGYFHAFFSESNPTHYHIYHPVLHERGKGRYVGLYFTAPRNTTGAVLEGDPIFTVDSTSRNNFRYTGGEDYYNSAWWFWGILFSKPFSGHVNFIKSFYRFHILDAIDFNTTFDFSLQPGTVTDLKEDFRTVAYYYKRVTAFWTSRDTIRSGELWNVSGTGYKPNSVIIAKFDNTETIFTTTANDSGAFNAYFEVQPSSIHGARTLSINDEVRPEPVYILGSSAIRPIVDSLPTTLRYRDTLLVTGTGFDQGENVQIFLDSILISGTDTIVTGRDYRFNAKVRMPNIADWKYHLRAVGDHHNDGTANDLITITRIIPYEFEDIIPWANADNGPFYYKNLSTDWGEEWSQQAIAVYEAKGENQKVAFKFYVPLNDTFDVRVVLTAGVKFGNFTYSVDGKYFGTFNGYAADSWDEYERPSDTLKLHTIFFTKDTHTIVFKCLGKDTAAKEYRLGADLLLLTPTTKMALPKGVFVTPKDTSLSGIDSPGVMNSYIILYPNPIGSGELTLGLDPPEILPNGKLDIILTDIIGRRVRSEFNIPLGTNGAYTHFDVYSLPTGNYLAEFIIHSGAATQRVSRMVQIRE